MARKSRQVEKPVSDDEVDAFDQNQDEILLSQAGRDRQPANAGDDYEMSDEEVMGLSGNEDEEEMDYDDMYNQDENWGTSRANLYGADEVEGEDDARLEEEEALRLQKKHLSEMAEDDYYDSDEYEDWKESSMGQTADDQLEQDPSQMDDSERLNLLKLQYPEVLPLAQELSSLSGKLETFDVDTKVGKVQYTALTSYLGTIHAYFALFISGVKAGKISLKDHPVMEGIVKAREVWRQASELGPEVEESEAEEDEEEEQPAKKRRVEPESESEVESEIEVESEEEPTIQEPEDSDDEFNVPLVKPSKKARKSKNRSDFMEAEAEKVDQEDKDLHKKSIRFYTSKIDQESKKRARDSYGGGDDDLPYKERHFERQKRLMEEARQRGLKTGNDLAENFDSDNEDGTQTGAYEDDEDYYNQVVNASRKKKDEKRQGHEQAVAAAKEGKLAELQQDEELDDSGKRALNFQILKNKGLTPKRNKDNRNSRVKKRKRYEKAKKKLNSVKSTFKQPTTSYGGEQTGIKKNITRSVKFAS